MAKSLHQIIADLVDKLSPALRNAFLASIQDVTDNVILADMIKAIEANDYQRAFRVLGLSDAAMRPITKALADIFETGGNAVGDTFPKKLRTNEQAVRSVFRFDVRNPRAEKWLQDQSGSLITRIKEDARVNIRNVMQVNLEAGNNPKTTALDIVGRIGMSGHREGGIIGLAQNQELWVRNARRDLQNLDPNYFKRLRRDKRFDSIVKKAVDNKSPLSADTIEKLISRYKDSLLQLRGETIARTETIQSLNRSEYEAFHQAIDSGAADQSAVKREWDATLDDRTRDTHRAMDGQEVGLDEPFKTPDGELLMFPGDYSLGADASEIINCRCRVKLKVDWLADID